MKAGTSETVVKSPLQKTVETGLTDVWNDSCSIGELTYAIENGAVGATTNPVIVGQVLKKEMKLWEGRIRELIREMPEAGEIEITWKLIEEMAIKGAELLLPVFKQEGGKKGRLSIQTNPMLYRNAKAMLEQAVHFAALAPNMQVKLPATRAGIAAMEEATYRGVNLNATVSFTVPQALAVGEAIERGLERRDREGLDTKGMSPVCTIMVGRLDDWLKVCMEKKDIITDPGYLEWAGVAAFKKAYGIYRSRGYRTRLLSAAYRNHMHWSEFIGGDVVLTIPYKWQQRFNASSIPVEERMSRPVDEKIVRELLEKFPEFGRAYEENGLSVDEFDSYGATARTLRSFIASYTELLAVIRDFMLPNPDA